MQIEAGSTAPPPLQSAVPKQGFALSLAVISSAHAVQHAMVAVQPLVLPYAMAAMGFDYAALGLVQGASNLLNGLLQGIYAWLSRFVRRKTLIAFGSAGMGLSMALMALSTSFWQLSAAILFGRVASSPQHPMANSLMSDWYAPERRGAAFSIHYSGGNVGAILVPLLAGFLIVRYGWQAALHVFALPSLLIGLLVYLFTIDPRRPEGTVTRPSKQAAARLTGHAAKQAAEPSPYWLPLRDHNVRMIILSRAMAAGGRGIGAVMLYVPMYFSEGLGFDPVTTGTMFAVMMAGGVVGPVLSGRMSDRWGRKPLILASFAGSSLGMAGLLVSGASLLAVYAAAVVLGLFAYNESALSQTYLADQVPAKIRDEAFSLYYVLTFMTGAFWAAALGIIVNSYGFHAGFLAMIGSYLVAALPILTVRPRPIETA